MKFRPGDKVRVKPADDDDPIALACTGVEFSVQSCQACYDSEVIVKVKGDAGIGRRFTFREQDLEKI